MRGTSGLDTLLADSSLLRVVQTPTCLRCLATLLAVSFLGALPGSRAKADILLGDAASYGFIAGPNTKSIQISNSTFNGNGATDVSNPGSNYVQFSSGTINGNFDFVGADNQASLGAGHLNGTIKTHVAAVGTAYTTITNLSNTFAGEAGTSFGGSGALTASNGILDASGNRVFTTTANNFLQSGALTITGSASDYVVINVTGNNNVQLKNLLSLSGGITDDHVFVNITGSGQQIGGNTNGGIVNGTIVALNDKFNIDNTTIDGRLFGGDSQDFQLVSGLMLNAPPAPESPPTPEPTSFVLCISGLLGIVAVTTLRRPLVV